MTAQVQDVLHTFDLLPEGDKRELAGEILRRSLTLDVPALSDEQLVDSEEPRAEGVNPVRSDRNTRQAD